MQGSGFRDLIEQYEAKNVQVLGVSFDTREENERFAEKFDFPFPLIGDADHRIGIAYGAAESKKDQYARRIAYVIGEDGRILQAHAKVDAKTYPREQLGTL